MRGLAIINRGNIQCQLYLEGNYQNLNTRFKKEADLDNYIARLLAEGWRLQNVDQGQMYFVCEQPKGQQVSPIRDAIGR